MSGPMLCAEGAAMLARIACSGSTASTSGIPLWSGSWRHYSTRQKVGQTYRVTQSTGIPRKGEQGDGPPERQPSTQPLPEGADVVVPMDALTTPPDIGKHSLFTMVGGELTRSGYAESIGASSVQERLRVKLRKEPAAAGDKGPSSSSSSLSPGPQGAAAAASKPIDFFSLSGTGVLDTGLTLESPAARPQLGEEARTILQKIVGHLTKEGKKHTAYDVLYGSMEHIRKQLSKGAVGTAAGDGAAAAAQQGAATGQRARGKQQQQQQKKKRA